MWLMRTDRVSVFRIEASRGGWVVDEAMLGERFKGVVCSDFYGVYTAHDDWQHGYPMHTQVQLLVDAAVAGAKRVFDFEC
jgi:hypothetical protein